MSTASEFRESDLIDGRYEVLAVMGEGAVGTVYRARDRELDRQVAVKIISQIGGTSINPEVWRRLVREGQALSLLKHPGVIEVYRVGVLKDGRPFLVIEFVEGKSLAGVIAEPGPFDCKTAADIVFQVAEALAHAHSHGVIHRDVKPQNILMQQPEGNWNSRLVDFGLSAISDELKQSQSRLTMTGEILGTPQYMAPEQCRGEKIDERADVYSLGLVFFELLTGVAAFAADNAAEAFHKQLNDPVPNLLRLDPAAHLPQLAQDILDKSTAKNKADRYQSAAEMAADLKLLTQERSSAVFDSKRLKSLPVTQGNGRSTGWKIALTAIATVAVAVFGLLGIGTFAPSFTCAAAVKSLPAKQATDVVGAVAGWQFRLNGSRYALSCTLPMLDNPVVKLWSDEDRFAVSYAIFKNCGRSVADCLPLSISLLEQGERLMPVHREHSGYQLDIGSPNGLSNSAFHYRDARTEVGLVDKPTLVYAPILCDVMDSMIRAKLSTEQWRDVLKFIDHQGTWQNDWHSSPLPQVQAVLCKEWELTIVCVLNSVPLTVERADLVRASALNACSCFSAGKDPRYFHYKQVNESMTKITAQLLKDRIMSRGSGH